MVRVLPPLASVVGDAARLARARLAILLGLAALPLLPLALFGPFVAEVAIALQYGVTTGFSAIVSPWTALIAAVGLLLSVAVSLATTAAMFVVLGSPADLSLRAAVRLGVRRWVAFLWTQVLVGLAMVVAAVPSLLFAWWLSVRRGLTVDADPALALAAVVIALLLAVPVLIVASWYAVAPVSAARGEAWGSPALAVSHRLVQGATAQTFGILFVWFLFELFLSVALGALFPGLSLFQSLVFYFVTSILGNAYLFALYRALRRS